MKKFSLIAIILTAAISLSAQEYVQIGRYRHDVPSTEWEAATKKRADMMKYVRWTPIRPMPKSYKGKLDPKFNPGETVTGAPYSSVSTFHNFIGRDVTFYTFLSAMNNPESYIYCVNYHDEPWKKTNAGPFYGSVCSSTVCWCWGLPDSYSTYQIRHDKVRYLEDVGNDLSQVKLFDGICYFNEKVKKGHILMFYDIARDEEGNITKITTFESCSPVVRLKEYTPEEFIGNFVIKKKARFYRLRTDMMASLQSAPVRDTCLNYTFPKEICLKDGDAKSFPERDTVRINILKGGYRYITLVKDGTPYETVPLKKQREIEFTALPAGQYEAFLTKGKSIDGKRSDSTVFEICNTRCRVRLVGDKLAVTPDDPGMVPLYCTWKSSKDRPALIFNKVQENGAWTVDSPYTDRKEIAVDFAGRYNNVKSRFIKFQD